MNKHPLPMMALVAALGAASPALAGQLHQNPIRMK